MNSILFALFGLDILATVLGIYAMRSRTLSGKFTAISAGVMVGVAVFWIFPDMTRESGTVHAALIVGVALTALYGIDRFVYPVCPCCSHAERHGSSASAHHPELSGAKLSGASGALIPLVIAICIHNLFDGWTAAAAGHAGSSPGSGIAVGLIAHKIPEALVFGLMLRNVTKERIFLLLSVSLTSLAILVGGAAQSSIWMLSETVVIAGSLALACGSFLFAAAHMFLRQQRRAGTGSALLPLVIGLLLSAALEQAISTAFAQSH